MEFKIFFRDLNTDTQLRLSKFLGKDMEQLSESRNPITIVTKERSDERKNK